MGERVPRLDELIRRQLEILEMSVHAFGAATFVVVLLRIYSRAWLVRRFGNDDWAMVLAQIFFMAFCCLSVVGVKEQRALLDDWNRTVVKRHDMIIRLAQGAWSVSTIMIKVSVGIFFARIFNTSLAHRIFVWTVVVVSTICGLVYFALIATTCGLQSASDTSVCTHQSTPLIIGAVWGLVGAATDIAFSMLAILALWQADLRKPAKLIGCGLLAIAGMGSIASCIRVATLIVAIGSQNPAQVLSIARWSVIEVGSCILAASMVTLRPLVNRCLAGVRSSVASNNHRRILYQPNQPVSGHGWAETMKSRVRDVEKGFRMTVAGAHEEPVHPPTEKVTRERAKTWVHPLQKHDLLPPTGDSEDRRGSKAWLNGLQTHDLVWIEEKRSSKAWVHDLQTHDLVAMPEKAVVARQEEVEAPDSDAWIHPVRKLQTHDLLI